MQFKIGFILMIVIFNSCNPIQEQNQLPLIGTWELIAATSTEKDSTVSTFNPKLRMIKMINSTHFSF